MALFSQTASNGPAGGARVEGDLVTREAVIVPGASGQVSGAGGALLGVRGS